MPNRSHSDLRNTSVRARDIVQVEHRIDGSCQDGKQKDRGGDRPDNFSSVIAMDLPGGRRIGTLTIAANRPDQYRLDGYKDKRGYRQDEPQQSDFRGWNWPRGVQNRGA